MTARPVEPGATLGPYRVEARIGAEAVGEVYRARDTRLGRDVTLKLLSRELAPEPARRERLLGRMRAAAALNHPNICTVHEIGRHSGHDYVVLEYIEGRTLASLRKPGGLSLDELVDLFLPLSEALDYAHRRGIVHGDLSPASVMVSTLGLPKILDFGMGNAEDVLGQPVDVRTDVHAFGGVLYELATGSRAKGGQQEPLSRLRPDLPAPLAAVVERSLRKASAESDPTMSDFVEVLRALRTQSQQSEPRSAASIPAGAAVIAGLAVLAGLYGYRRFGAEPPIPTVANPSQITVAVSLEDYPTWSPDGRTLAFESNEAGNWDIWVAQLEGGPGVNRTGDHAGDDRYPSWSPDGRQIAYWSDRGGGGYYLVPALGGPSRRLASTAGGRGPFYYSPPQWSADGKEVAYVMTEPGARLDFFVEIQSLETRGTRRTRLPGSAENRLDLSWSRDERHMAYVDLGSQYAETSQLRVLRLADGESFAVTDDRANVRGPIWSPNGHHLYFSANRVGASDLWRQRMADDGTPRGAPEQVTTAVEVRHGAFSADGRRMAFSKGRWVANIWRVPILADRPATWADAEPMTSEQAFIEFLDLSRDGRRLLFSSDRAGNQDLWTMPIGGEMTRLTTDPAPEWAPQWSPDEREIAFYSARSGDREIWVMPAGGGKATRLTHDAAFDGTPMWSPDGRTLVFRSERTGDSEIWTVTRDGSQERQVTQDPAADYGPVYSPDGQWLAYSSNRGGARELWRLPAEGGDAERLGSSAAAAPIWSPDGAWLYFGTSEGPPRFRALSAKDRRERVVADLVGRRGDLGFQPPATDGKYLYFSWRSDVGDIWVMDVGRD